MSLRVVFMGTPDFAGAVLRRLVEDRWAIAAVFTSPDKPKNRGMKMMPTPVKEYALTQGIPILPQYRGAAPINWAILNGDQETGVTIQYMAAELDAGDILLVKRTPIGPDEDAGQLYSRLAELGGEAASEALRLLEEGGAPRTPQVYGPQYQYASMLSREMSPMDWGRPARELVNQVRGLVPWPCAATDVAGVRWKVYRAQEGTETDRIPGTILSAGKAGIEVACGDGRSLLITELQADGGRRMAAADYLRGHPVAVT